jgi:AraC-like DNA-binding protein
VHGAAIVCIYGVGFSFILQMRSKFMQLWEKPAEPPPRPSNPEAEVIVERLRDAGVFRRQKLTLAQAATELSLTQRSLTEAVADCGYANFSEMINQLRVDAFKRLAQEPASRRLSLFGLAQEVGFASKASFHRIFKKHCDQTPSEFVAELAAGAAGSTEASRGKVGSHMAI